MTGGSVKGLASCLLLCASVAGVAGCGDDEASESTSPAGVPIAGVEYAFEMPESAEAGVVRLDVSNQGGELHEYAMARLEDGKTLADVEAYLKSGREGEPSWADDIGGVPLLSPGEEISITRDLEPGTYALLCFIPSPKGVPHIELGMQGTIELEGDSGAETPEPDAVISATEDGYEVPEIAAGTQTIELRNDDEREREFFLIALEPGKDLADVDAFFAQGEDQAEPPATFLGAMQTIPPGESVFAELELEAGVEYTLVDNTGPKPVTAAFTPE